MCIYFPCLTSNFLRSSSKGILRPYISEDRTSSSPDEFVGYVGGAWLSYCADSINLCFSTTILAVVGKHGVEISPPGNHFLHLRERCVATFPFNLLTSMPRFSAMPFRI